MFEDERPKLIAYRGRFDGFHSTPSHLHVAACGDHSLVVLKTELKASGLSQLDVDSG